MIGAIVWNLFTWWLGLPSSSSHALVGGLCGAAIATAQGNWGVLHWSEMVKGKPSGLWPKIVLPMFSSPLIGFVAAYLFMMLLYAVLKRATPHFVNKWFGKLQIVRASWMGFSHGSNDAQKTMGIIALALFTGTQSGAFNTLPDYLSCKRLSAVKWGVVSRIVWAWVLTLPITALIGYLSYLGLQALGY